MLVSIMLFIWIIGCMAAFGFAFECLARSRPGKIEGVLIILWIGLLWPAVIAYRLHELLEVLCNMAWQVRKALQKESATPPSLPVKEQHL